MNHAGKTLQERFCGPLVERRIAMVVDWAVTMAERVLLSISQRIFVS
jgi:hypothetical protein